MKRTPRPVCSNTWILQPLHFSKILEPRHLSLLLVSQNWNLGREASHIFGKCWHSQPECHSRLVLFRVLGAKCSVQPSCEGLQLGMTVESGQMHSSENLTIDCTPCSSQRSALAKGMCVTLAVSCSNWCSETFASHGSFDQQPVE